MKTTQDMFDAFERGAKSLGDFDAALDDGMSALVIALRAGDHGEVIGMDRYREPGYVAIVFDDGAILLAACGTVSPELAERMMWGIVHSTRKVTRH